MALRSWTSSQRPPVPMHDWPDAARGFAEIWAARRSAIGDQRWEAVTAKSFPCFGEGECGKGPLDDLRIP